MTRQTVGEAVAARLFAAELAIDAALAETAALIATLPAARAEACLSAVTGQRAFDHTAASIGALTQARFHMVATHKSLSALARTLGLEIVAMGPLDKPEDRPPNGVGIVAEFSPNTNKTLTVEAKPC